MMAWIFILILGVALAIFVTGYGFGKMDGKQELMDELRKMR